MNFKKIIDNSFSTLTPLTNNEEIIRNVTERAKKMEKKKKISVKKPIIAVCAATAVLMLGTIVAAAESHEFNQFIYTTTGFVINPDKVIYATPIPQHPIDGFSRIEDIGTPIAEGVIKQEIPTELYSVPLTEYSENKFTIEKIAYDNGQTIVLDNGFELVENQDVKISIDADFSAEYHTDRNGEYVAVGYIYDNVAYDIFSGKTNDESLSVDFSAEKAGTYGFYIINCCAGLQNYDSVTVEITDN